jgi:hypothetical protein
MKNIEYSMPSEKINPTELGEKGNMTLTGQYPIGRCKVMVPEVFLGGTTSSQGSKTRHVS